MADLFGYRYREPTPDGPPLSDAERKRIRRRSYERARGYYATPGTGPSGETCGSCAHLCRLQHAKVYLKCEKARQFWTGGPATDVRAGSPACKGWDPKDGAEAEAEAG
jgi:hypothetical protein